uniref:DNA mismatch repair MutH/Type II restriction enzyme Sau3AI domain-containing protein n=1 Tax=viral metagenome TaxID=1070528 RepID=A0A6C0DRL3_9ZZZZ
MLYIWISVFLFTVIDVFDCMFLVDSSMYKPDKIEMKFSPMYKFNEHAHLFDTTMTRYLYYANFTIRNNYLRPTIDDVINRVMHIKNKPYILPKTSNKGGPGNYLECLTGIPTSSDCLDCMDGELKVFPLKKLKNGVFTPKENVAITMVNKQRLFRDTFNHSKCFTKIQKILFVPYYRDDHDVDIVTYMRPILFDIHHITNINMKNQLHMDYDAIQNYLLENDSLVGSSKIGTYLQTRTKGPGKNKDNKSRAFYFRAKFLKDFMMFTY